ncbi:cation:H+ antiporter [Lipingzhangella halophila]|uniref:Cation:H+ antiporter n=1 Tax=Lipingzhangella halophila TaxID=1783352 RepID=A0A7W7W403_9ACTN|nr:sodium:proton exchanger [Lipingzhangella halophila]MBB4932339.1 cation:H+ antiporter [Lipingzhangella halophila]
MTSILIFLLGAALLIYSAERLIGYLVGVASGLRVSVFLLAIIFTGIEFDDVVLGVVLNVEELDHVALGIVFGTTLSLPGIVLALAAILTPTEIKVPRDYVALFALAPVTMIVFTLLAPLTVVHGVVLLGLFVLFLGYITVRESKRRTPVFRDAEMYETYVALQASGGGTPQRADDGTRAGALGPGGAADDGPAPPAKGRLSEHIPFGAGRERSGWIGLLLAVLALAGLVIGAAATGVGVEGILEEYGIEGTIFGATIVTVVLTIEDLFLTVEPARKGAPEIGVGNVIGSVVFSVTGKLGIILLAGGLVLGPHVLTWHLPVLIALTGLAAYFLSTGRLKRWHGYTLLGLYIVYWVVSFFGLGVVPVEAD